MLNLNKTITTISLLILALTLSLPFINGAGCHALLHSQTDDLGELHGRCEQGKLYVTVSHKITKQTYLAEGMFAYFNDYYFIIINKREISDQTKNQHEDWKKGSYFYRNVYAGVIQDGRFGTYLLSSSPVPLIMKIDIHGELGFISPRYD